MSDQLLRSQLVNELIKFQLGPFFLEFIAFLQDGNEVIAFAGNSSDVFIGQFAPFFLEFGAKLFPVAFDLVPFHGGTHFS